MARPRALRDPIVVRRPLTPRRAASLARALALGFAATLVQSATGVAQDPARFGGDAATALASWLAPHAPPGDEHRATALILESDPRWERDHAGNLVLRTGSGQPRRVIACALDHSSLAVSQITDAGYLRLHRSGSVPRHVLWDQSHEGQQVLVMGRGAPVPGVIAIPNGHFGRQHRGDTAVIHADDLWVDVGAASRAEALAMGIALLDPVVRDVPPWTYEGHFAGANAGGRAGCAALAGVAAATVALDAPAAGTSARMDGETTFVIAINYAFGRSGLGAALAGLGPVDHVTLVLPSEGAFEGGVRTRTMRRPPYLPARLTPDSVNVLDVATRFTGTLVESVRLEDADALRASIAAGAGVDPALATWTTLPTPAVPGPRRDDALTPIAELLRSLADLPGVPGQEHRVRNAVRDALPVWARERAVEDSIGNLIVAAGPDRDTVVFIAHLDEVGYIVAAIAGDGTVSLTSRGGVIPSAWEGQPALLHFDPEPGQRQARPSLRGVFIPRAEAAVRRPTAVRAWFGMDSAALVAAGVRPGLGVTAHKRAQRLGDTRFTARSLDDRAGTTALLLAIRRVDPGRLPHKVLFVWSVQEESGLTGARFLAERLGTSVRRVHAVDTFVSSDTPLESPHFAHAPLGAGPVLRGLDDGMVVPRAERERMVSIARSARIPLQVGTTHGSTDGTPFLRWGVPNTGLSWPGRYSHSPAELLDLRDLDALARLVFAAAMAPQR